MKRKEGVNGPFPEDARRELGRCGVGNALFHNELHAYKRMFSEDEKMDESYKILLLCLFMQEKQLVVPQTKKQNGKLDEPLLPILRSNRSEQILRLGQDLNGEDNMIEDAGTGLKEWVEMPNKKAKNEALLENETIVMNEGVGSNKDNEPEPERKSTTTVKPNVELRRSRKVNYKEPSNEDMDDDGREDIVEHPSHEVGNVLMKSPQDKNEKAKDTKKRSSRRSSKATYKEPSDQDEDEGEEIEKRPSHKIGNVFMKNPKDKNEKADIEKFSSRRSRKIAYNDLLSNENERVTKKLPSREVRNVATKKPKNENVEANVEKNSSRRSRKLILEESSDEGAEIRKHSSREVRNVVMKKPKNEKAEAEIKKHPSHRSKKVFYKEHSSGKDEDEREEIEKRSSREVRNNVLMKKSKKAQAEIEKLLSRRSKEVFYQDYSSNDDREEIEKRSSRKVRNNVVMKKSKKAGAKIEKLLSRRSRGVSCKDYSSNENSDKEIKKHASRRLWKTILAELSDKENKEKDVYMEIERRSSREVRNVAMKKHKNEKVKDEIKKRSYHQSRKVCSPKESTSENEILLAEHNPRDDRKFATKRPRDEDIEEQIERLRNYLLKRSRYGIEGCTSHNFRVGESSAHPKKDKKTDKDSLEDEETSDDDSELEILDKDEYLNGPFVTAKSYIDLGDCYNSSEETMEFRRKVLEVISKPYNKSEYNALYAEFREKCYPAHHSDLVDKLKMNRWRPRKRLAILRGYFFWLQNLTQKGSFKPWNDSVCLNVEPEWPLQTRQTRGNRLSKKNTSGSMRG